VHIHCDSGASVIQVYTTLKMILYINSEKITDPEIQEYVLSTLDPNSVAKIERISLPIASKRYLKFYMRY
jgi:hypothetical protein